MMGVRRMVWGWLVVSTASLLPGVAHAAGIFLNGVNIEGVSQQRFEQVTVEIDAAGNVWITAPGYEVQQGPAPVQAEPADRGPVEGRYFLVAETNAPGQTGFDIDVFVNAVWVKRVSHEDAQSILELSPHLRKGRNRVHFTATKRKPATGRDGGSARHVRTIVVGEGTLGGDNVTIHRPLIEYRRTAAQPESDTQVFELVAR